MLSDPTTSPASFTYYRMAPKRELTVPRYDDGLYERAVPLVEIDCRACFPAIVPDDRKSNLGLVNIE
jgi:hypothetical protein